MKARKILTKKRLLLAILLLFIVIALAIAIGTLLLRPADTDQQLLADALNNEMVEVEEIRSGNYYVIRSKTIQANNVGLIWYPGGLVTPESYLYNLTYLAEEVDVSIFVPRMPLNLAILDIAAADRIITAPENKGISEWIIGGHSLGGAMACRYTDTNYSKLTGLILAGSYCDLDITDTQLPTISIVGERDGLYTIKEQEEARTKLSSKTRYITIPGMNHAQFGSYGTQRGDLEAGISNDEANKAWIRELSNWLEANLGITRLAKDSSMNPTNTDTDFTPQFVVNNLVTGLTNPWDVLVLRNNDLIFTQRGLGIFHKKANAATYDHKLIYKPQELFARGEGGMHGLALSKDFEVSREIFACFNTLSNNVYEIRVARLVLNDSATELINREDIVNNIPAIASGRHSGCRMAVDSSSFVDRNRRCCYRSNTSRS